MPGFGMLDDHGCLVMSSSQSAALPPMPVADIRWRAAACMGLPEEYDDAYREKRRTKSDDLGLIAPQYTELPDNPRKVGTGGLIVPPRTPTSSLPKDGEAKGTKKLPARQAPYRLTARLLAVESSFGEAASSTVTLRLGRTTSKILVQDALESYRLAEQTKHCWTNLAE